MTSTKALYLAAALTAAFLLPIHASAQPAAAAAAKETKKGAVKAAATPAPTAQQIADAKSKGLVWVNLNTKVYHKEGQYYGATAKGKFMTEADAQKAGYKAAQEPAAKKKAAAKATTAPAKK